MFEQYGHYVAIDIVFHLITIISIIYLYFDKRNIIKSLEKLTLTDYLTGVPNRRKIDSILDWEYSSRRKDVSDVYLMLLDIDYFKDINDTYGHDVGDVILKEFADLVMKNKRVGDVFGRYGGEEFMLVYKDDSEDHRHVMDFANRLNNIIRNHVFADNIKLTCSIGISNRSDATDTPDLLVKRADDALYKSKHDGRDRINCNLF